MGEVKRQRIRVAVAAYIYECTSDSFLSDTEYDRLALSVADNLEISTGVKLYDDFFLKEFTADSGMWVRKHPDFHNGRLKRLADYLLALIEPHH